VLKQTGSVMFRSAMSRSAASAPPHLTAGVPRNLVALVAAPTVAVATGMHFNPDFRRRVESSVPGASAALAKITQGPYGNEKAAAKTNLPSSYENIPDLLARIAEEDNLRGEKKESKFKQNLNSTSASVVRDKADASPLKRHSEIPPPATAAAASARKAAEKSTAPAAAIKTPPVSAISSAPEYSTSGVTTSPTPKSAPAPAVHRKTDASPTKLQSEIPPPGTAAAAAADKAVGKAMAPAIQMTTPPESATSSAPEYSTYGATSSSTHPVEPVMQVAPGKQSSAPPTSNSKASPATVVPASVLVSAAPADSIKAAPAASTPTAKAAPSAPSKSTSVGSKPAPESYTKSAKDKLAIVFGRGDFEPSAVPVKDIVDVSVYKRPNFSRPISPSASPAFKPAKSVTSATGNPSADEEIAALRAELEGQAKWDAVRLQEAVRAQSLAEKKVAAAEAAALTKKHKLEMEKIQEKAMADAEKLIGTRTRELTAAMNVQRDREVADLLKQTERVLKKSLEAEFLERERKSAIERQREFASLKASVSALHASLDHSRELRKASKTASAVAASAFALKDAVSGHGPFDKELEAAAAASDLGELVSSSVPASAGRTGVPTVEELRQSFETVSLEGRKAALVPANDIGNMWSHVLASLVSRIKVAVNTVGSQMPKPEDPQTDEDRIRLAEKYLAVEDLSSAVQCLSNLGSLPGTIVSDWVALANARIAADLGAQVMFADAIITQLSLAAGGCKPMTTKSA
jgi:Mitochondrial inner membrane protein